MKIINLCIEKYGVRKFVRSIKVRYPGIYSYIVNKYPALKSRPKDSEKFFWFMHSMVDFPKCPVCGKSITCYINFVEGYNQTCSMPCGNRYKTLKYESAPMFEINAENDKAFRNRFLSLQYDLSDSHWFIRMVASIPDVYNYVFFRYEKLVGHEFSEKFYWFLNGLNKYPICPVCGKHVSEVQFRNVVKGYSKCHDECHYACEKLGKAISDGYERHKEKDPEFVKNARIKRQHTKYLKYGDENYNNFKQAHETLLKKYGKSLADEMNAKSRQTKLDRYGDPTFNNVGKRMQTCLERYGVTSYCKTNEFLDKIKTKNLAKLGVEFPGQCAACREKQRKTVERLNKENPNRQEDIVKHAIAAKRKNGSFRTSKPENNAYALLVKLFGENDIERNWDKDARYPFACDFYVKSIDMFIECNFHWTHGGHWFDENNPEDVKRVESFKLKDEIRKSRTGKQKSLYGQCIDTWTRRDKLKHQTAIANNLNYIVFWTYDEVVAWINAQSK